MIILASGSPRRKELISYIVDDYAVIKPNVEEKRNKNESIRDYIKRNARLKADAIDESSVIISADTIVICNEQLLEKPNTKDEAFEMIKMLSDYKEHQVLTAFCVRHKEKYIEQTVCTKVYFRELTKSEIKKYIETGEPMDKAGAYAAQGRGAAFIKSIEGSYTNVVGLPLAEVVEALGTIC